MMRKGLSSKLAILACTVSVLSLSAAADTGAPTLEELQRYSGSKASSLVESIPEIRQAMIRQAALNFGVSGGLAWRTEKTNKMLAGAAAQLTKVYNFNALMIKAPAGFLIQPPVVVKQDSVVRVRDDGQAASLVDTVYMIVAPGRLRTNAPLWQEYLIRDWPAVTPPDDTALPTNDAERKLWAFHVERGWEQGVRQAEIIFEEDSAKLARTFEGMILYLTLVEEGRVQALYLADAERSVHVPDGATMKIGLRDVEIKQPAAFRGDIDNWEPLVLFRDRAVPSSQIGRQ